MRPMTTPDFEPLGNRCLVLPDPQEEKVEDLGEYQITQKTDPHEKPVEGTVITCGSGCTVISEGNKVFYGKYAGLEQELDGVKYLILQESEIVGKRRTVVNV